ncbi:hypothetical protein ABH922_000259 [Rhodococcus sp. 27YEA15]|uniref:alpha/beta hydrolase n=1 Tax=Rhodococcus sp. 27YEA15 TaxID=3156259 RepID=UPI003C7AB28D
MNLNDVDEWDPAALSRTEGGLEALLLAHRMAEIQHRLRRLREDAAAEDLHVRDDGSVSAVVPIAPGHPLSSRALELTRSVDVLRAEALLIDAELPHTPREQSSVDLRDRAFRIAEQWSTLDCATRQAVSIHTPDLPANLDGIPAAVRDRLNRRRIHAERARLQEDAIRSSREADREFFGGRLSNTGAGQWYAQRKLEDLDALEQLVHQGDDLRVVLMDMRSGERGFAAVAVGDPDRADHVGVTIPGLNTNVKDSMRGMVDEARRLRDEAQRQLRRVGRDESVATIAWIGYDAPQVIGPGRFDTGRASFDVSRTTKARIAAQALGGFLHGLRAATINANLHLCALGHSYGSLATSLALQRGASASVDDVVFYGSPGVRAKVETDLGLERHHVYVMKAEGDSIAGFGRFGGDPTRTQFLRLSTATGITADGVLHERAFGHAEYARTGDNGELRMSGYNLAVVLAGLPELAVTV